VKVTFLFRGKWLIALEFQAATKINGLTGYEDDRSGAGYPIHDDEAVMNGAQMVALSGHSPVQAFHSVVFDLDGLTAAGRKPTLEGNTLLLL
jgi:hypothetical protein